MPESSPEALLKNIVENYNLELVILYGSRARGTTHAESDSDVAVRARGVLTLDQILAVSRDFDALYPNAEVCDIRKASPLLLANIAQDGKLIFERAPLSFYEFKLLAINQYLDYKPYFEKLRQKNQEEIERM
jgi:predicted nucleotidyltransferase